MDAIKTYANNVFTYLGYGASPPSKKRASEKPLQLHDILQKSNLHILQYLKPQTIIELRVVNKATLAILNDRVINQYGKKLRPRIYEKIRDLGFTFREYLVQELRNSSKTPDDYHIEQWLFFKVDGIEQEPVRSFGTLDLQWYQKDVRLQTILFTIEPTFNVSWLRDNGKIRLFRADFKDHSYRHVFDGDCDFRLRIFQNSSLLLTIDPDFDPKYPDDNVIYSSIYYFHDNPYGCKSRLSEAVHLPSWLSDSDESDIKILKKAFRLQ